MPEDTEVLDMMTEDYPVLANLYGDRPWQKIGIFPQFRHYEAILHRCQCGHLIELTRIVLVDVDGLTEANKWASHIGGCEHCHRIYYSMEHLL